MIRRKHGISLSPQVVEEEDVNPNSYMVNIADCMLVLLLGTLVALISYYNVDLTKPPVTDEIIGIEMNMDQDGDGVIDAGFTPKGTVYVDESTGEYYMVADGGK